MSKRAFLFPGQGSQYVGMAKDLFDNFAVAKDIINEADSTLGFTLSQIMFNGPVEELKQTEYTQPAIFLHSVVISSIINKLDVDAVAGHSLGEYSALVTAGAIQLDDAVKLVRARGVAMQEAGVQNPGTMAAIIGLEPANVKDFCGEASADGVVQCANFNSPGQIVISGSVPGVKKGMELCKTAGAKVAKELIVSAAFHSPLMESAKNIKNADADNRFDGGETQPGGSVTISLGLVSCMDNVSISDLIREADSALYKAKETGKNKVVQRIILKNNLRTETSSDA